MLPPGQFAAIAIALSVEAQIRSTPTVESGAIEAHFCHLGPSFSDIASFSKSPAHGEGSSDTLPSGRFATLTYMGVKNGHAANAALIAWIEAQGE